MVIMTDCRSSNMSFLDSKMLKNPGGVSGEKEYIPRSKMFPCYGNKLLQLVNASWLKMIQWKRWRRKQFFHLFSTLKRLMKCTRVNQENGIEIKWKAADSSSNEKRQAKALFQKSEINAFLYYADHEYEHFKDAATYDKVILHCFNTIKLGMLLSFVGNFLIPVGSLV